MLGQRRGFGRGWLEFNVPPPHSGRPVAQRRGFGRGGPECGAEQDGLMTVRAFNFLAGVFDIEFKVATAVLTGGFGNHGLAFRNGLPFIPRQFVWQIGF